MFDRFLSKKLCFGLTLVLIVGCSDSGTPPDDEPGGEVVPVAGIHNFLSYKVTVRDTAAEVDRIISLKALNIDKLSESIEVDTSDDGSIRLLGNGFQRGDYDEQSYTIKGYHTTDLLYLNQGRIKKQQVYKTSTPHAQQLSSESNGYLFCQNDYRRSNDYANRDNSRLVYKIVDSYQDLEKCHLKSGQWYMVKVTDDETTNPVSLPTNINFIVDAVHAKSDGSLYGWIAVANNQLTLFDSEFQNPQTLNTSSGPIGIESYAQLLTRTQDKQFVLEVDSKLYIYDPYNNVVLNNQASFTSNDGQFISASKVSDGANAFFTVLHLGQDLETVVGSDIYSLDLQTGSNQLLASENTRIGVLTATDNYLVYTVANSQQSESEKSVKKLSKQGGEAITVGTESGNYDIFSLYAAGQYYYINYDLGESQSIERINESQDVGTIHEYHRIIGAAYGDLLRPARAYLDIDYFVVIQSDPNTGAKNLHAIKVDNGEMYTLGALPNEAYVDGNYEFIEALGHTHALVGIYHQGIRDLYYMDIAKANSLKRLSEHTPDNENGIYYKALAEDKRKTGT